MTEADARALAREINQHPGWTAYAEEQPFINPDAGWWVRAHHASMLRRAGPTNPFPTLPITSREEWIAARARWAS